jgi:hypothetical protein
VVLSLTQLLVSLPVQVDESVDEVGDACTYVNEVDNDVFKIDVQRIGHVEDTDFLSPKDEKNNININSLLDFGYSLDHKKLSQNVL